mgnify:CR=1 FL=1
MKVISLGECMLEVKVESYPQARFGYGGDTFNTAYYLAQLGIDSAYATALGDDALSQWLLSEWREAGISTPLVRQLPNRSPGIYCIQTDSQGERQFNYWRQNSAARSMLNDIQLGQFLSECEGADLFYFSLISVAVLEPDSRETLLTLVESLRSDGVTIVFDNNYRPQLWSDQNQARSWAERILPLVDIYLPSLEDEAQLFDIAKADLGQHFNALGIAEIVVKDGAQGCQILLQDQSTTLAFEPLKPLDTTAAGDSFNAGYLAARLRKQSPEQAVKAGHRLASQVIMHPGALISASELELAC